VIIAAAILLSTLITAVGTRYSAIETSNEEIAWLVDRLTGNVYKCQAETRGKASCDADVATGSITQPKH
jgi:archaellum component FlaF (FlaF/FlaG flagellin family)